MTETDSVSINVVFERTKTTDCVQNESDVYGETLLPETFELKWTQSRVSHPYLSNIDSSIKPLDAIQCKILAASQNTQTIRLLKCLTLSVCSYRVRFLTPHPSHSSFVNLHKDTRWWILGSSVNVVMLRAGWIRLDFLQNQKFFSPFCTQMCSELHPVGTGSKAMWWFGTGETSRMLGCMTLTWRGKPRRVASRASAPQYRCRRTVRWTAAEVPTWR